MTNGEPYTFEADGSGRFDINGVEWFACDPYPTWFRWEENEEGEEILYRNPAPWADEPLPDMTHVMPPEECYGHDNHGPSCDGVVRNKWSGVGCKCGARWFCL